MVIVLVSFLAAGTVIVTGQPGFCNSCHIMNLYYASWKNSAHSKVNCLDCHLQPGFTGYVKGKINGLAQAIDCLVGRVSPNPSATVKDASCLRSDCHSAGKLASKKMDYHGVQFTHGNHISKVVDGVNITCGTCHNHFEGNQHFSVENDVCYTCHFIPGGAGGQLARTSCRACHEVPKKVIQRGQVTINHAEFVAYGASCEASCHKDEMPEIRKVDDRSCLSCHTFTKGKYVNGAALHKTHTGDEKVECFACHGQVLHGPAAAPSLARMMDCQNCHSDTHKVQKTIYASEQPIQGANANWIVSPMFLTHVECTGCHTERVSREAGALNSFGAVAKAVPGACDTCHEKGTGQNYVPFWQGQIKAKYNQIRSKVDNLDALAQAMTNQETAQQLHEEVTRARLILEAVLADGSWGVHNFKYTEAMLLRADAIVSGANK
jgi:nitrate/TMAO reductase-like tetraheme cytochrome c subunit